MKYVTRAAWQARPPTAVQTISRQAVDTIFFHYSAAEADEQESHANCASRVRGIQRYHQDTQHWNDIAYSFLVCKHGYVFEGRGYGVHPAATGADNSHSLAVCFLGDDSVNRDDVTQTGRMAFVEIAQGIERWAGHRLAYRGHRDAMSTRCPGDEIHAYIHSTGFAQLVRNGSAELRARTGYYAWAAWRLGEGDWKPYGPLNPSVRPNVPANIIVERPLWFPRLALFLAARNRAA